VSAPLTPATVQQCAQTAATSPAHLDPQVVQQVCQEWEVLRETIGCGEAVLQAYDMTPKGLVEMADWLSSETNCDPECREAEIVAALRSTSVAFAAHEGWLHLAVAERNDAIARAEQAESALASARQHIADTEIQRDTYQAENVRLRAALEAVEWVLDWDVCGGESACPWCDGAQFPITPTSPHLQSHRTHGHAPDCQRQAALGLGGGQ